MEIVSAQMINIYKPMIKTKMEQNINIRADAAVNLINRCIQTIINDTKENNIKKLIESHNPSLNIPSFDLSSLKQSSKQKLYTKVDEWKGLCNFKRKSNDIKSYKKNADGWWNRKKPDLLGEHFFHPLLQNVLPMYIKKYIIGTNISSSRYGSSNPLYLASYDLVYFSILYEIFHEEIAFSRTKFLPFILDQCFMQSKCRHTLQQLLITLGDTHDIVWNNKGVTKGDNARNFARKWASKILTKIRILYKQVSQPEPEPELEAYGEINMSNINDNINDAIPSISYSISSEPVMQSPFIDNYTQQPVPMLPPIINNNQSVNTCVYNHFNNNNICYNNNNNNNNPLMLPPLTLNCNNDNNNAYTYTNTYTPKKYRPYRKIHNISPVTPIAPIISSISCEPYCGFSTSCSNDFPLLIDNQSDILLNDMDCDIFDNECFDGLDQFNHDDNSFHFV